MQTYELNLQAEPSKSYFCQRAADSLDIDVEKKLTHTFKVEADLTTGFNVGLIVGSSGSGKSTLARQIWGKINPDEPEADKPILDQFENLEYQDRVSFLTGMGLTQVTNWIKPYGLLSTGEKARASAALAASKVSANEVVVIDEWTSTVNRDVAHGMSQCMAKMARKQNKSIVLLSCHSDITPWLNPDWIIDSNSQTFINRRSEVGAPMGKPLSLSRLLKSQAKRGNTLASITI